MRHSFIAKTPKKSAAKGGRRMSGNVLGIALICVGLLAAAGVVRKAFRPVWLNCCESRAVHQLRRQCDDAQREHDRLLREKARYQSRSGAAAGARELGYVRPGEVPVSIEIKKDPEKGK